MERVSSKTSLMAPQMESVSTRTTPSHSSWHIRKHSTPTCFTATPSAKESTLPSSTLFPYASDWAM
eukprot:4346083-Pyramimonas_sp.AAC.1